MRAPKMKVMDLVALVLCEQRGFEVTAEYVLSRMKLVRGRLCAYAYDDRTSFYEVRTGGGVPVFRRCVAYEKKKHETVWKTGKRRLPSLANTATTWRLVAALLDGLGWSLKSGDAEEIFYDAAGERAVRQGMTRSLQLWRRVAGG